MIEPESFRRDEIVPIPAICTKKYGAHEWIDGNGNGAIRAPSLRNCRCFYCGKPLKPHPDFAPVVDAATRRRQSGQVIQATLAGVPRRPSK